MYVRAGTPDSTEYILFPLNRTEGSRTTKLLWTLSYGLFRGGEYCTNTVWVNFLAAIAIN